MARQAPAGSPSPLQVSTGPFCLKRLPYPEFIPAELLVSMAGERMDELHKRHMMMLSSTSTSKSSSPHPQLSVTATCSYTSVRKFLLYFAASVTALLTPRHCMVHGAAQYEDSHGDWASCPSRPACASGVPSLPVRLSQEFAGVYGHSSSKKE